MNAPDDPSHGDLAHRSRVRRAFDRLATGYREAAQVQSEIGLRMLSRLELMKLTPAVILDAGAGVADGAAALAQRYVGSRVLAVDLSWRLLQQRPKAQGWRRWLGGARASGEPMAVCADFMQLPLAAASVDLVMSNLALNWASDLGGALRELHRVLKPGGLLMLTMLGPDTLQECRPAGDLRQADPRLPDMHDVGDLLGTGGFSGPVMDQEHLTLTYNTAASFRRDLRLWGAAAIGASRPRGAAAPHHLRDAPARVTLEIVYGHAWKAAARPSAERLPGGGAVIRFDRAARR